VISLLTAAILQGSADSRPTDAKVRVGRKYPLEINYCHSSGVRRLPANRAASESPTWQRKHAHILNFNTHTCSLCS